MKGTDLSSAAPDHLVVIEQCEVGFWKIADDLRANSGLASNEYFMPIVGLLFPRHASNHSDLLSPARRQGAGRHASGPVGASERTDRHLRRYDHPVIVSPEVV